MVQTRRGGGRKEEEGDKETGKQGPLMQVDKTGGGAIAPLHQDALLRDGE